MQQLLLVADLSLTHTNMQQLLDCFSPLFEYTTEKSKGDPTPSVSVCLTYLLPPSLHYSDCWLILCQLVEVLASFQVSQTDVQKLILKFQGSRTHMVGS